MKSQRFLKFYQSESEKYHGLRYGGLYGKLFKTLHHEALSGFLIQADNSEPILEIACGTGHTTGLLVKEGFDVIACDLTPGMMQRVSEQTGDQHEKVSFVRMDAFKLPFPDACVSTVVSTRFLHLFPADEQELIITEMYRVLKPGGVVLVDFDSWVHRWCWALPFALYNLLRYQRLAPYSIYNRIGRTITMASRVGFSDIKVDGIGGAQLLLPALISGSTALKVGRMHRRSVLRLIADQFMVCGKKY